MRTLPLLLLLAGCVGGDRAGPTHDEAELARNLDGRTAGAAQSCLPAPFGPGALQPVNARTLTVRQGDTIWVNRLAADCSGLRPFNTLIVEVHGGQYCRGDRIRAVRPGDPVPGPACLLGDFTPYRR